MNQAIRSQYGNELMGGAIGGAAQAKNCGYGSDKQLPEPLKPVPAALENLSTIINDLGAITDNFVSRVAPVLRPSVPIPTGTGTAGQDIKPPTCDVALSIQEQAERIANICNYLQHAIDRLEV